MWVDSPSLGPADAHSRPSTDSATHAATSPADAGERQHAQVGQIEAAAGGRLAREERADADGDHRRARRRRGPRPAPTRRRSRRPARRATAAAIASRSPGASCSGSAQTTRARRARTCSGIGPRPSGNVHVHCAAVSSPRSRWASAAIANSSEETGHGRPPIGTCDTIAATFVRSAPVYTSSHASSRWMSVRPRAATSPPAIGITSVVVPPQSSEDRVGHRAGDQQRGRDPVRGRARQRVGPRLFDPDQRSGRGDHAQRSSRQRRGNRVQHVQHPGALALEHVDELRRRRQRHRRAVEPEPADDRRDRVGQFLGRAPHLERLGDDPDAAVAGDGRRLCVGASDVESDHGRGGAGMRR